MGQQQLLLLILGTIVVGVSIVVGINMFGQSAVQANQDAVLQDVLTIASRAQEWARKPAQMGGGRVGATAGYSGVTLAKVSWPATNANGSYALSSIQSGNFVVTGTGSEGVVIVTTVYVDSISSRPTITLP